MHSIVRQAGPALAPLGAAVALVGCGSIPGMGPGSADANLIWTIHSANETGTR